MVYYQYTWAHTAPLVFYRSDHEETIMVVFDQYTQDPFGMLLPHMDL